MEGCSINDSSFIIFRWLLTFFRFTYSGQVLSHSCQKFDNILVRSYCTIIDISMRFREWAFTQQCRVCFRILSKAQEMIDIWNFTEVRTNWIQEQQLIIDVSFDQISSRFIFTIQYIKVFQSSKIVESMFNNISINHFFISLFYFHNLFLHLRFENLIKISIRTLLLFLSHIIFLLKAFIHKHFEGRKLDNSSICVLFSEISIVNRITS